MPITLFTGLPGAGKTAQLVAEILRLREESSDRPIFALGINGLKEGLAIPLTEQMLHKWWELPPGSIICLDECQEDGTTPGSIPLMPKDRGVPASWVQHISKVRHYGMDFLLTTQDPCNMSAYVRRLVDKHVHTIRKFRTNILQRYTWGRCIDDPYSSKAWKDASPSVGTLPSKVFELYKSSQLHTMKPRIPWKVYAIPVLAIVVGVAVFSVLPLMRRASHVGDAKPASSASAQPLSGSKRDPDESLRHQDFAKWMRPRIDGLPWSAPMFDKLEVKAEPRLFCVAVDDGRCSCNTEQGTHYAVDVKMCRRIVEDGLYNPFVAPMSRDDAGSASDSEASTDSGRREAASPPAAHAVGAVLDEPVASSGSWKQSSLAAAYQPPELAPRPTYAPHAL